MNCPGEMDDVVIKGYFHGYRSFASILSGHSESIFVLLAETIGLMSVKHQDQRRIVQDNPVFGIVIIKIIYPIIVRNRGTDYLSVEIDEK